MRAPAYFTNYINYQKFQELFWIIAKDRIVISVPERVLNRCFWELGVSSHQNMWVMGQLHVYQHLFPFNQSKDDKWDVMCPLSRDGAEVSGLERRGIQEI